MIIYDGTNTTTIPNTKRYRYTGMERDEETGLNYHNARYYMPWLGRWLNPDPIVIGDGVNVYAYCGGNPVTYNDTEGTQVNKADYTRQDNAKFVPRIELKALMEANKRQSNVKEGVQLAKAFSETYNKNNPGFHEKAQAIIAKQQKKSETAMRVEGALQIVSGTIEASVGGAGGVITSETGVGAAAGWAILTQGVDNMVAGYNKLMTGKPSQTQTEQLISAVAQDYTDKATADKIGAFGNTVIGIAGSSGNLVSMVDAAAINSVKPIVAATQEAIVARGVSGKTFTESEIKNFLTPTGEDDVVTIYRGMTGREAEGALFLTEDAAYAASYSGNVRPFTVSRSGFEALKNENLIEIQTGINSVNGAQGPELKIPYIAVKEVILGF